LLACTDCAKGQVIDVDADAGADTDADAPADVEVDGDGGGAVSCTPADQAVLCGEAPCVDGYCCDEACDGPCRACDLAGTEGRCQPIPAETDPDEECAETGAETCGTTGVCDGTGQCALFGPETPCDDHEPCSTGDACDGSGACAGVMPEGCEPGPGDQCCEASCEGGGCVTVAGDCAARCGAYQLITGLACVGCGAPGAEGVCSGGAARACNAASHVPCEEVACGGETYRCTNAGGTWEWRTGVACDDGDACTLGDACVGGLCASTPYGCVPEECLDSVCDGAGGCIETPRPATTPCGATACPADACDGGGWLDYPADCTGTCDDRGSCAPCACVAEETTCGLGPGNECCEAACSDAAGCYSIPGSCGAADSCSATVLDIASACTGCGFAGAVGVCGDAVSLECSGAVHVACQVASCNGVTYYCTNAGGTWQWRAADPRCDDADACTHDDSCGAAGCQGTPIACESTACAARSCNGTATCDVVPLTGTPCEDGDPCTFGETCTASGACPGGAPISCADTECLDRECNGSSTCTETARVGAGCNDGDPCTWGETCSGAGACGAGTPIDCDGLDWTCADFSCDGTSTCSATPINVGFGCDDGDPDTDFDQCQPDGTCAGDPGCPPPVESCANGAQNRRDCSGARIIGRTIAAGGFVIDTDTCSAWDEFDDSDDECWDAGGDHAYRLYMRTGEVATIHYENSWACYSSDWYDGTIKIFENSGCADTACTSKVFCRDFLGELDTSYVAVRDGWIIIVVDGTTAFDDEGDYTLRVDLACSEPGCEC
jgi:hypothetical protein